jgi:hypothetical protein
MNINIFINFKIVAIRTSEPLPSGEASGSETSGTSYSSYASVRLANLQRLSEDDLKEIFGSYKWKTFSAFQYHSRHFSQWLVQGKDVIPDQKSRLNCWEGGLIALITMGLIPPIDVQAAFKIGRANVDSKGNPKCIEQYPEIFRELLGFYQAKLISEMDSLQEGDILFFNGEMNHVAISLGGEDCLSLWRYPQDGMRKTTIDEIINSYNTLSPNRETILERERIKVSTKFRDPAL